MQAIIDAVDKIARWIVLSSANPTGVALTVKGLLVGTLPVLMILGGVAHINVGQDQLTAIFDAVATFVQAALALIAAAITLWGLARKIWLTISGQNTVNG